MYVPTIAEQRVPGHDIALSDPAPQERLGAPRPNPDPRARETYAAFLLIDDARWAEAAAPRRTVKVE